ncbi:hypothetical protein [Halorussus halobius]|uniref:hypothetical protein n=1 Tax=Halorussus halobius TaxID=1710537 RepID=UPI0010920F7A|nr:hypothetical protein [Halorussus halobius]
MPDERRRAVLEAAVTSLASVLLAGCTSTETEQSSTDYTNESETDSTNTASTADTSTQSAVDDYGPWGVVVVNDLEAERTVTVRILTFDGAIHDETEVTVAGGDGTEALSVSEPGTYTLEASTASDGATMEFDACKLNSDAVVELGNEDERRISLHQRHSDPGAGTTIDDPYACE